MKHIAGHPGFVVLEGDAEAAKYLVRLQREYGDTPCTRAALEDIVRPARAASKAAHEAASAIEAVLEKLAYRTPANLPARSGRQSPRRRTRMSFGGHAPVRITH